jgi:hypothetical protein
MIEKPKQLENPNLDDLREICQEYMDYVFDDPTYNDDRASDYDHYVFEEAISAIFGKNAWNLIVAKLDEIENEHETHRKQREYEAAKKFIASFDDSRKR